jgi:hypothetical protein
MDKIVAIQSQQNISVYATYTGISHTLPSAFVEGAEFVSTNGFHVDKTVEMSDNFRFLSGNKGKKLARMFAKAFEKNTNLAEPELVWIRMSRKRRAKNKWILQ